MAVYRRAGVLTHRMTCSRTNLGTNPIIRYTLHGSHSMRIRWTINNDSVSRIINLANQYMFDLTTPSLSDPYNLSMLISMRMRDYGKVSIIEVSQYVMNSSWNFNYYKNLVEFNIQSNQITREVLVQECIYLKALTLGGVGNPNANGFTFMDVTNNRFLEYVNIEINMPKTVVDSMLIALASHTTTNGMFYSISAHSGSTQALQARNALVNRGWTVNI